MPPNLAGLHNALDRRTYPPVGLGDRPSVTGRPRTPERKDTVCPRTITGVTGTPPTTGRLPFRTIGLLIAFGLGPLVSAVVRLLQVGRRIGFGVSDLMARPSFCLSRRTCFSPPPSL